MKPSLKPLVKDVSVIQSYMILEHTFWKMQTSLAETFQSSSNWNSLHVKRRKKAMCRADQYENIKEKTIGKRFYWHSRDLKLWLKEVKNTHKTDNRIDDPAVLKSYGVQTDKQLGIRATEFQPIGQPLGLP